MIWIIFISVFVAITLIGLVIFSWKNAQALVRPKLIPTEREIEINKERGLWLDFDKYDKQDYKVEGKDGYLLNTTFVSTEQTRGTGRYVIIAHGHTSSRYGSVKYVNCYIRLGFSCVIYDARGHGQNAPANCTLGDIEAKDLLKVIEDTRSRYNDIKVLGLHGESMGSSSALIVTKYDPKIDFIVADCPNMGAYEVISDCYNNIHLRFLAVFCWLGGKIIYGVDCKESDAYRDSDCKCPVLFIHGAGDTFIKPYHSERLYEKVSQSGVYTELILVEGAGHARCRSVAGFETYTGYIENFLKKNGII
ncbi:MAG: alpha/beta hydrolase [Clostridiales bacterium]|nr:alpha/beta hydrolase [Clostridiales bacterium]